MTARDRLDAVDARLAAAPLDAGWYVDDDGAVWVTHDPEHTSCSGVTGRLPVWADGAADLIAHAPTDLAALVAVVREVEVLHRPHPDGGQGYDAAGKYVWFDQVCQTCGQYDEYAVAWPCPTAAAVQKLGEGS